MRYSIGYYFGLKPGSDLEGGISFYFPYCSAAKWDCNCLRGSDVAVGCLREGQTVLMTESS